MKARTTRVLLLSFLGVMLLATSATGCGVYTYRSGVAVRPAGVVVAQPNVVYATVPPARVYHQGNWLLYRGHAYYYDQPGPWIVATSVPAYVAHYHHPYVRYRAYPSGYWYSGRHYRTWSSGHHHHGHR